MNEYYLNVHYGYGTKSLPDGSDAMFENYARITVEGRKFPTNATVRRELHNQGFATRPVRSVGFFCYHTEQAV